MPPPPSCSGRWVFSTSRRYARPGIAVASGRPDFANYDEAEGQSLSRSAAAADNERQHKVTTLEQWKKRRAEIKALFDEDVYGKYPAHIPGVTWKVTGIEQKRSMAFRPSSNTSPARRTIPLIPRSSYRPDVVVIHQG